MGKTHAESDFFSSPTKKYVRFSASSKMLNGMGKNNSSEKRKNKRVFGRSHCCTVQ